MTGTRDDSSGADAPALPDPARVLPHEPPFLFVDEVTARDDDLIRGRWHLTGDEDFFAGHFPDTPVLPGVLITEALAQLGAVAVLTSEEHTRGLPLFGGIDRARFRRPVRPGDVLEMEVRLTHRSARAGKAAGQAHVDGELACDAQLLFVVAEI